MSNLTLPEYPFLNMKSSKKCSDNEIIELEKKITCLF